MTERKEFEMTQADYDELIKAMQPVPYLVVGGVPPRSRQESANDAWARLGKKMGFKFMTVKPSGPNALRFTAEPEDHP